MGAAGTACRREGAVSLTGRTRVSFHNVTSYRTTVNSHHVFQRVHYSRKPGEHTVFCPVPVPHVCNTAVTQHASHDGTYLGGEREFRQCRLTRCCIKSTGRDVNKGSVTAGTWSGKNVNESVLQSCHSPGGWQFQCQLQVSAYSGPCVANTAEQTALLKPNRDRKWRLLTAVNILSKAVDEWPGDGVRVLLLQSQGSYFYGSQARSLHLVRWISSRV